MGTVDVGIAAVLSLFVMWGWLRGLLRQALGLLFLGLAFWIAGTFSGRLEGAVAKVATMTDPERCVVAWITAFVGVLLAGAAVMAFLRRGKGPFSVPGARPVAAVLGLAKGWIVLIVAFYALLSWFDGPTRPNLVADVETSVGGRWIRWTATRLDDVVPMPACVRAEIKAVNARLPD